jgi:hypothetical protein
VILSPSISVIVTTAGPLLESIIPGLESALSESSVGDKLTVTVEAADAYGERNERPCSISVSVAGRISMTSTSNVSCSPARG